jgi:hypothetical protein
MTLRESLGDHVQRVYEQVDALLDREDGLLVLFDGDRMVSYTQGFVVSPCQLELLSVELERVVVNVVARQRSTAEHEIDEVLSDSFPASDPPSWNPGVAHPDQ